MVCNTHHKVERWDCLFAWGFGNVPSPRWWEAYVLHTRFEIGISFDILTWKFGIDLGFRYRDFGVNIGPVSIWFNKA